MVWTDAGQPGRRRAAGPRPSTTACRCCSVHAPCLLVTQRVWSPDPWERLRRVGRARRRRWARRPSWCTRRSPGSATTPAASPPACAELQRRASRASRSRWRTCTRCGWRGREFVPYQPGWDPTEAGYDAYTLDLSHCAAVAHRRAGDGRRDGRRPGPRAPRRRHRRGPRRAPGAGPGQPAVRRAARARWPGGASPARSRWRWPPGGREPRGPARPTWPSRWRSPATHLAAPSTAGTALARAVERRIRGRDSGTGGCADRCESRPARRRPPACGPGARPRASGWRSAPSRTGGSSSTTCPGRRCRSARRRRRRSGRCRTRTARPPGPRPRRPGTRR